MHRIPRVFRVNAVRCVSLIPEREYEPARILEIIGCVFHLSGIENIGRVYNVHVCLGIVNWQCYGWRRCIISGCERSILLSILYDIVTHSESVYGVGCR